MECQDIRLMLAFSDRPSEKLDPVEGQALQQHLEACPDCAQAADRQQADRGFDQVIGLAMRDVPMSNALAGKLKQRLAADRPVMWKRWAGAAAAAVVALALTASGVLYVNRSTAIDTVFLGDLAHKGNGMNADDADQFFKKQGLDVRSPREFDFDLLRHVEVVVLKNRQVAKLTFVHEQSQARASVLVLPQRQFHFTDMPNQDIQADVSVRFTTRDGFTYAIYYRGQLDNLLRVLN